MWGAELCYHWHFHNNHFAHKITEMSHILKISQIQEQNNGKSTTCHKYPPLFFQNNAPTTISVGSKAAEIVL